MNKEDYGFIIGIPNRKGGAKSMFRFSTRVRVSRVEESVEDHIDISYIFWGSNPEKDDSVIFSSALDLLSTQRKWDTSSYHGTIAIESSL